ncbi:precorrin-2 C(20)-methyltransferase [Neptuniibacter caesariensis]|uniref:Cobalamin biosynthesis precorrin-2 methyltransferase n=1 Tax=Neptuniibacter caesariensis TaxID=207954 RepID=A0A7U8C8Y1_NEPCE|nr:precorrin-2 C(20)-methyltransferase [Neptuniibacter caesariensis]EAR62319.1 cobalamin biosynthesis precorrin-2 methyltransferase [Oceanospirillum sp. MED92] [Neptuniibacter caesariensis]
MNLVKGRFIGVGVGPGDPELLTVKAWRLIQSADVISYLVNDKGASQAKQIASEAIYSATSAQSGIPIYMPMSTEREKANQAYDQGAVAIAEQLEQGLDVIFLCEGDPLFFGSFSYLLERLQDRYSCEVVPGITSVNAAAATLVHPLTMLKESFAVVNGRHSDEQILAALQQHDTLVIMKAGQARPRLLKLLEESGRSDDAQYLEYIGRDNQRIVNDVRELEVEAGPYFSLFVITRSERQSR